MLLGYGKVVLVLSAFIAVAVGSGRAFADKSTINSTKKTGFSLQDLQVESSDSLSLVTLNFSDKPSFSDLTLTAQDGFIEALIPNVATDLNVGEVIEGKGPYIRKYALFPMAEGGLQLRLFLNESKSILPIVQQDVVHGKYSIKFRHDRIEQVLSQNPSLSVSQEQKKLLGNILNGEAPSSIDKPVAAISATEDVSSLKDKSTNVGEVTQRNSGLLVDGLSLQNRFMIVAAFIGILCLILLVTRVYKSGGSFSFALARKNVAVVSPLKLLGCHALSPKHRLSLFDVDGEKILLAVTPEGIQYLTKIEKPQQQMVPMEMLSRPAIPQQDFGSQLLTADTSNVKEKSSSPAISNYKKIKDQETKSKTIETKEVISDVRKLIREKLKNLPPV